MKAGGTARPCEIPNGLLAHLSTEGSHAFYGNASVGPAREGAPADRRRRRAPAGPLGLLAVPLAFRGAPAASCAPWPGRRSRPSPRTSCARSRRSASRSRSRSRPVRLLQQERESYRFLDRLREVGRSLSTTFDVERIKQTLCEQAVSLLKADAAQFWDRGPGGQVREDRERAGARTSATSSTRAVPFDQASHPIVRTFLDKTLAIAGPAEGAAFFPGQLGGRRGAAHPRGRRPAHVPRRAHRGPLRRRRAAAATTGRSTSRSASSSSPTPPPSPSTTRASCASSSSRPSATASPACTTGPRSAKRLESEVRRAERNGQSVAVAHLRMDGLKESVVSLGAELRRLAAAEARRQARPLDARRQLRRARPRTTASTSSSSRRARCRRTARCARSRRTSRTASTNASRRPASRSRSRRGISVYPDDAFDTATLLGRAEDALDEAVKAGPGSVVLYHATEADAAAAG